VLLDGVIGVAGFLAAIGPLEAIQDRLRPEDRLAADELLAGFARGHRDADGDTGVTDAGVDDDGGVRQGPPATPGELRNAAQYLAAVLAPDGAEPKDRDASSRRFVRIGAAKNGLHSITGNLLPEVAAQLQLIFDAHNNPKVGGAPIPAGVRFSPSDGESAREGECGESDSESEHSEAMPDTSRLDSRDAGMKRHDALAAALGIAARHEDTPTLGGASPTLVVHVNVSDLATGSGWARIPGAPGTDNGSLAHVPVSVATHTACTGAIQRVLMDEGRIVGISVTDRVFTVHQRRAIILRDKECLIPGCHVPASWCEIHHVTEHARGGPTHTDNGVPLCWWHHRSLDTSGWEIRMHHGVPEIRGPGWWDPARRWRTPRPILRPALAAGTG
ncbi:DUF222 domain-containing protein, partial [Microbacterium sp. ZW T5_45]|uniref:HNH endonuclease signature motif containing protein n=1 Tax=Microbacterium sp. ZW T5_45 TaxID=3378080 RepID=UPI0038543D01